MSRVRDILVTLAASASSDSGGRPGNFHCHVDCLDSGTGGGDYGTWDYIYIIQFNIS